LKHSNQEKMH